MNNKIRDNILYEWHSWDQQINIPEGIKEIKENAFGDVGVQGSVTSIYVPDSVKKIGHNAFSGCHFLTDIRLPSDLTEIPDGAFERCFALKTIDIPETVETIGNTAFMNCDALGSITLPDSVTDIGAYAFRRCDSLKSIKISRNLKHIHPRAFVECTSLKDIRLPEGLETIGLEAFLECKSLKEIHIPDSVTEIAPGAFLDCSSLEYANIPAGINDASDLGKNCFSCENLKKLDTSNSNLQMIRLDVITDNNSPSIYKLAHDSFKLLNVYLDAVAEDKYDMEHLPTYLEARRYPRDTSILDDLAKHNITIKYIFVPLLEEAQAEGELVNKIHEFADRGIINRKNIVEFTTISSELNNPEITAELLEYKNNTWGDTPIDLFDLSFLDESIFPEVYAKSKKCTLRESLDKQEASKKMLLIKYSMAKEPRYHDVFSCLSNNEEWLDDEGLRDSEGLIAIDEREDAIMGYAFVTPDKKIFSVFVFPEYRGIGLGKLLIKKAISNLKGEWLEVEKTNENAINIYLHLGFKITSEGLCYSEDDPMKKVPCYNMTII